MPHRRSIHDDGGVVPGAEWMRMIAGKERVVAVARFDEGVEEPAVVVGEAELEEEAVVAAVFLKVDEALFFTAGGGRLENHLGGELGERARPVPGLA